MVDPLSSFFRTPITQQTLSKSLQTLLQTGNQRGLVQQSPDGKWFVNVKGQQLQINNLQNNLQLGQTVTIKLQNGQILIEQSLDQSTSSTQLSSETSRSIASILSKMGIHNSQANIIAQAMLQSNIPLDSNVLQQLSQLFPQLNPESMQTLIFLISRRLPISDSMLYWFTRILSRRENTGKLAQSVMQDIEDLQDQLKESSDDEINRLRQNLGEFHENLQEQFHSFQQFDSNEIEEEAKQAIQSALLSAEALLSGYAKSHSTLSETIVRLLAYLLEMKNQFESHSISPKLQELIAKVEALQELLTSHIVQNISQHGETNTHNIFIRIPIWEDKNADEMEILYKKGNSDHPSGSVDLRIDLSNLGLMKIHIGWHHPQVNIGIDVERDDVKEFLSNHIDELKDGLQQSGFKIDSLNVKQSEIPTSIQPQMPPPLHSVLSGIDIRG